MATSVGEWFFYAVAGGTIGWMFFGMLLAVGRALIGLLRDLFGSDDPQ